MAKRNIPDIHREPNDNFLKILPFTKSFVIFAMFSVEFQIFLHLFENLPKVSRKLIAHEFFQKLFPSFTTFRSFPIILTFWILQLAHEC